MCASLNKAIDEEHGIEHASPTNRVWDGNVGWNEEGMTIEVSCGILGRDLESVHLLAEFWVRLTCECAFVSYRHSCKSTLTMSPNRFMPKVYVCLPISASRLCCWILARLASQMVRLREEEEEQERMSIEKIQCNVRPTALIRLQPRRTVSGGRV